LPWLRAHALHLALFAVGLVGYGAVAGDRLGKPSAAPHFVLQANAWLHGELAIAHPRGDDSITLILPHRVLIFRAGDSQWSSVNR